MEIGGVGATPLDEGLSGIARGLPITKVPGALAGSPATFGADSVAGLLSELSQAQLTSLLSIIEPGQVPPALLNDVTSAASRGDVNTALSTLAVLASVDPKQAESFAVHKDIDEVFLRWTEAARLDAQVRLQDASGSQQPNTDTMLQVAARLIEAGGFANYVHSAQVSRMIVEGRSTVQPEQLLRGAVEALEQGNTKEALAKLESLARTDPRRAVSLAYEPALAPIRREVETLLARLTNHALQQAQEQLTEARQYTQDASLLTLAASLIAAGGLTNLIRSAEVSQTIIRKHKPSSVPAPALSPRLKNLWRRAPLLVLLLAWLIAGLMGASIAILLGEERTSALISWIFEIWALGFLALVLFGFYMRVRSR